MSKRLLQVGANYFGLPPEWYAHLNVEVDDEERVITLVFVKVTEEHKGYFRELLKAAEATTYKVRIFCPVRRTREIIARLGYGPVSHDMWVKGVKADFEDIKYGMSTKNYADTAASHFMRR